MLKFLEIYGKIALTFQGVRLYRFDTFLKPAMLQLGNHRRRNIST